MTDDRRVPRIVVVGSVNLDLVLRCAVIARRGETLAGRDLQEHFGGKGANQAVAAARLGADVWLIGRVGSDRFGAALLQGLQSAGVRTEHVQKTASQGQYRRGCMRGGQPARASYPGELAYRRPCGSVIRPPSNEVPHAGRQP
ncbi:MAG: PfkB family carbohydrate kinase [Planctomycetaceae bacterium]